MSQLDVYFSLQTQFENLGDCVINELLIRELARYGRVKILQSRAPDWLLDRLRCLPEIEIYDSKRRWLSNLMGRLVTRRPVVFAFKPGHYITSSSAKGLAYSSALMVFCGLCRIQGGRVMRSGVSLDRFGAMQSKFQSVIGRLHSSYGVRDQASLDYARSLGIPSAHYSPDLAFLLTDAPATTGLIDPKSMTSPGDRPMLSVSFRKQGLQSDSTFAELTDTLTKISAQHGLKTVVVEQVTFDRELASSLASRLGCDVVQFEQTEASVRGIFANYAQSRLVVSNRLHSLLFGWTAGAIPVPLVENTPHSKIIELFKHLKLSELIHFTDDIVRLPEHVARIVADESTWRQKLRRIFNDQKAILRDSMSNCILPSPKQSVE